MYKRYFKRVLDIVLSVSGMIVISPIFIIVFFLLFITNKKIPLFFQIRAGKDEKEFKIIKFKTMNDKRDEDGNLLPDKERLTKIGKYLRKTSLDEIPQLLNVLKGEMSLVGPRPLFVKYLPYYTEQEKLRHTVLPGITGWAQINGRNNLSWDNKFKLDVFYVNNMSFFLDIKILILTILKVLKEENAVNEPDPKLNKPLDVERKYKH
jgi:lipopolysaccharide/colanic/teichoic acid biosynthesis glycosyltransferase